MQEKWWLKGELFEGCNCNLLCPCHVSFRQPGTNNHCDAIWAVEVVEGRFGELDLTGLGAAAFVHCPGPTMADGDWTAVLYLDDRATAEQEAALQAIFDGSAGGPWVTLSQFFRDGAYAAVRKVPLEIAIDGRNRTVTASDQLFMEVQAIRGADQEGLVTLTNLRNVIHGPEHVMARSKFKVEDAGTGIGWEEEGKHGLYSKFNWSGP